jgi:aminopeptidase N
MARCRFFFAALLLILPLTVMAFPKDRYPVNPGTDIIHYSFNIFLNDTTDRIEGKAALTAEVDDTTTALVLDLRGVGENGRGMKVYSVSCSGSAAEFRHSGNRLSVNLPGGNSGRHRVEVNVDYAGIPADGLIISKNRHGDRTFFADNWPDRARNWIPCVDHPSDKATVDFTVTAPPRFKVVSNGYLAGEYPATGRNGEKVMVTCWKEQVPIPTKVMVIGVAGFAWETAGFSKGIPVQSWVFQQDREAGFADYAPAVDILTFYQDLIGDYSYEKLANVQSKTMFGGMENSGCIFYNEGSVNGKNTQQGLLAHEIAHQWFGDAVTEGDWHHIWLSEGFATYLEAVYSDSMTPGRNLGRSMAEMRSDVIRYYDRTKKPVIDTTITNYMQLLSTNSYQKGAWVLHMLREELGDSLFFTAIRQFYAEKRDRTALTEDFVAVADKVSGRKLTPFFSQWLSVAGQPDISWSWKYNKRKACVVIDLEQTQEQHCFQFGLRIELSGAGSTDAGSQAIPKKSVRVDVDGRKLHFEVPVEFQPTDVRLDPGVNLLFRETNLTKKALPDGISG